MYRTCTKYLYKVPKFLEIRPFILIYPFIKYCRLFDEGVELRRLSWLLPNPGEKTQKLARYFHTERY